MNQRGFAPILILIGIVLAVAIAGGAYYFGKSQVSKAQPQSQIVVSQTPPQPTITPFSSPNETANQKTYTNSDCKYSIAFPNDYKTQLEF